MYVHDALRFYLFFFNDTATTEIYTLSLHDALPLTFWLMGGLSAVTLPELGATAPVMLCALLPLMLLRWRINLLGLPDEEALALGVPVARLRLLLVACATLGTAAAVSLAGIVGWV